MINASQDPSLIAATISAIAKKRAEKLRKDAADEAERVRRQQRDERLRNADPMNRRTIRMLLDSPTDRS